MRSEAETGGLLVLGCKQHAGDRVPAVNHMGTGRLQPIRSDWNRRYHRLVEKFGERTRVPVLMNASFNLRGEPIVHSPANPFSAFSLSGTDILVQVSPVLRRH